MAVNNLANYTDKDGLGFPLNFRRGNPNPLDNSSVWASLESAQSYAASSAVAYVGQVLTVVDAENSVATVYSIQDTAGTLAKVGTAPVGDEKTITVAEDGTVSLYGIDGLEVDNKTYQPLYVNGTLTWVVPSETTVEGLNTALQALDVRVGTLEGVVGNAESGLVKQVNDLAASHTTDIDAVKALIDAEQARAEGAEKTNSDAIAAVKSDIDTFLNAADVSEKAVDTLKEIQDYINEDGQRAQEMVESINAAQAKADEAYILADAAQTADEVTASIQSALASYSTTEKVNAAIDAVDGKVNSLQTTVDGIPAAIESAITELNIDQYATSSDLEEVKALVGETSVTNQVATKLDEALLVNGEEKYALRTTVIDLQATVNGKADSTVTDALDQRIDALEASTANENLIEKITLNGTETTIVDKTVDIPAATAESLGLVKADGVTIENNEGTLSVKAVEVSALFVEEGNELVLNGGTATGLS